MILDALGLPPAQQNDISALTFLALCGVRPSDPWTAASRKSLTIRKGIMEFIAVEYGKVYRENTRESFRRQVLHQFHQAKVADYNPDNPQLPTNSPNAHYAISEGALAVARSYGSSKWTKGVAEFTATYGNLLETYARHRPENLIPVTFPDGRVFHLSPGQHNVVQAAIIEEFAPRFAPGAVVLYLGDTMKKDLWVDTKYLSDLGIPMTQHDKLPDVVLHESGKDWLFLIEAVTSHGPMSPKRIFELEKMLSGCRSGKIFVTAFPNFAEFRKNAKDVAWETEVWIAEVPEHLIHYNGDKFFGPR